MKRTIISINKLALSLALLVTLGHVTSCSNDNSKASEATSTEKPSSIEPASENEEDEPEESLPTASLEETAKRFAELSCKLQEISIKMQKQGTQDLTQLTNDQNEIISKLAEVEDDSKYYEKHNKKEFDKLVMKYMGGCKH